MPRPVREIKDTVIDYADTSVGDPPEIDVVYWEFDMTRDGITNPYWMVTLLIDGKLWVGFTHDRGDARDTLGEYNLSYTSLDMPWTLFRRAARRALDAKQSWRRIPLPEGYFVKKRSGTEIMYVTECGLKYHLTTATIEGLLR